MLRVYVGGPYRCSGKCGVDLNHMRRGLNMGMDVFLAGYYPFIPWLDYLLKLIGRGEELETKHLQDNGIAWLLVSDVLLIMPGFENSSGTLAEIEEAEKHGIPVVYSLEELLEKFPPEE